VEDQESLEPSTVVSQLPDPATETKIYGYRQVSEPFKRALNINQPVFGLCNRGPNLLKIRLVFQLQLNAKVHKVNVRAYTIHQSFGTIPLNCYDIFCLVAGQNMLYIRHSKTVRQTTEKLAF
jgi:hypothetical protein